MKKLMRSFKEIRRLLAVGEISAEVFEACRYDVICASVQIEIERHKTRFMAKRKP